MKAKTLFASVSAAICALMLFACGGGNDNTDKHECADNLVKYGVIASTCIVNGHDAHYACSVCGKKYYDSGATIAAVDEDIIRPLAPHAIEYVAENAGGYSGFYFCSTCGHFFADSDGTEEIAYSQLTDNSVKPLKIEESNENGNILATKSVSEVSQLNDIYDDFTVRMFIGWQNGNSTNLDNATSTATAVISVGDEECRYKVELGYSAAQGLYYKNFTSGATESITSLTSVCKAQGGVYVRIVRNGAQISLYIEDDNGVPRLICTDNVYDTVNSSVRFALMRISNESEYSGASAYAPVVKDAAICVGIANYRCLFGGEYAAATDITSDPYGDLIVADMYSWLDYPPSEFTLAFTKKPETVEYDYDNTKLELDAENQTIKALAAGTFTVAVKSEHYSASFDVTCKSVSRTGNDWMPLSTDYASQMATQYSKFGSDGATTLFVGDSFFDTRWFWENFYDLYDGKDALCSGISSTTTYDWEIYMITNRFLSGISPKNIVMNIGTNNFYDDKNTAEATIENLMRMFTLMHDKLPDTQIYYFSIAQRKDNSYKNQVSLTNAAMRDWCEYKSWITFIDVEQIMTADMLKSDGVHPSVSAYKDVYMKKLEEAGCVVSDK